MKLATPHWAIPHWFAAIAVTLFSATAPAATLGTLCEGCTAAQRVQSAETRGLLFPGDFGSGIVFVGDFPNAVIEKFYVFKENSNLQPQDTILTIKEAAAAYGFDPKAVLEIHPPIAYGDITTTAVKLQLTADEAENAAIAIDFINNVLRPAGGGQPLRGLGSDPRPTVGRFNVPESIANSAFDVIGVQSDALRIGASMQARYPLLLNGVQTGSVIKAIFQLGVNTDFAVTFEFPDGSIGDWFIDQRGELRANFDTFEDSERNPIPYRPGDVAGAGFYFGDGRESSNFQNMVNRVQVLGIDVNDTGSGGGACRFSCNNDACTVTCSVN